MKPTNTRVFEAFSRYCEIALIPNHNNPDLLREWGNNLAQLETQILCYPTDEGEPVPGSKSRRQSEDGEVWGPLRWPYGADTNTPAFNNPPMTYDISKRMMSIGTTWWNWAEKKTIRLGFDFDSIDHSRGACPEILARLEHLDVPWIEVIRSTRGLGRHLYLKFQEPYPTTENRTEHAALARAFLGVMAAATGLDLAAEKDVCGGVMWIYHANATRENRGYELLKPATQLLTVNDIPPNWRDHLSVTAGKRSKVLVRGWDANGNLTEGDEVDELTQLTAPIPLDAVHKKILAELERSGYTCVWVPDHHLARTHTKALLQVYQNWLAAGHPMRGVFDTISHGNVPNQANCFMKPRSRGGWDVFRFGQGTPEHALWDRRGIWTHTVYNDYLPFSNMMESAGGSESTLASGGYVFSSRDEAQAALTLLGCQKELPPQCSVGARVFTVVQMDKSDAVKLTMTKDKSDSPSNLTGWTKRGASWETWFKCGAVASKEEMTGFWDKLDNEARALKIASLQDTGSMGGGFCGWIIRDSHEKWVTSPETNVRLLLSSLGYDEVGAVMGHAIFRAWMLTNLPFQPEYPGGRCWNRDAPQYTYEPLKLEHDQEPYHPWWDRCLDTLGKDLDPYIAETPWCCEWNIKSGGDFLRCWISCLLRHPEDKLPYLFLHGPSNTGKTMFAEAIKLLVTRGVSDASSAMVSDYNGELANCILALVDEVNINAKGGIDAYNRLKVWSTGQTIAIHAKYQQVYETRNYLHFIQMANEVTSLPIFPGDTRTMPIYVAPVEDPVPKGVFTQHLRDEAPAFMHTLMNWPIQPPVSRFRMDCIQTQSKIDAMNASKSAFQDFLNENYTLVPGTKVELKDMISDFYRSLTDDDKLVWSKAKILKELLDLRYPVGYANQNRRYVGNITRDANATPGEPYIVVGARLTTRLEDDDED